MYLSVSGKRLFADECLTQFHYKLPKMNQKQTRQSFPLTESFVQRIDTLMKAPQGSYNCGEFVARVADGRCKSTGFDALTQPRATPVNDDSLAPGDVIFLSSINEPDAVHFAMYTGRGLFISKLGWDGILAIVDTATIGVLYKSTHWVPVVNRKDNVKTFPPNGEPNLGLEVRLPSSKRKLPVGQHRRNKAKRRCLRR